MEDTASTLNSTFTTKFDLDKKEIPQLGVHNQGKVNRTLITRDEIHDTSFNATLHRVHYGTYLGQPACLVSVNFAFDFRGRVAARYSYASIKVLFRHAVDALDHRKVSAKPLEDPVVTNFAPKEVYGLVKTVEAKKVRDISVPLMFESPVGLSAGIEGHLGVELTEYPDNRMEIHGNLCFDDDHDDAFGVTWKLEENRTQRDGIFRNFRAAIILLHPSQQPMWMSVVVQPSVKFSLNPQRFFGKNDPFARLLQLNDQPVLLDGKTPKGDPSELACDDFSSPKFPWSKVLWLPTEYKSQLMLQSTQDESDPLSTQQ